jgi:hypothetical protein
MSSSRRSTKLYVGPSTLRYGFRLDINDVGMGLFSGRTYRCGDVIATFKGETVTCEEFERRKSIGLGEYGISIGDAQSPFVLDCRNEALVTKKCKASMSNDPGVRKWNIPQACFQRRADGTVVFAKANAHAHKSGGHVYLIAGPSDYDDDIIAIEIDDEIFWNYL